MVVLAIIAYAASKAGIICRQLFSIYQEGLELAAGAST